MTIQICRLCLSLEDMILQEEGTGKTTISLPLSSSPWTLKAGDQPQLCLLLERLYLELLWGILYLSSVRFMYNFTLHFTWEHILQEDSTVLVGHFHIHVVTWTTFSSTRRQATPGDRQGRWRHREVAIQLLQLTTFLSSAPNSDGDCELW